MVRVGVNVQEIILDPFTAGNFQHFTAIDLINEPLVYIDDKLNTVGALAKSWTITDEGKTYTFKLRSNATFHDGKKITSADVKNTILKHIGDGSRSFLKDSLLPLLAKGAASVKTPDQETIEFDLKGAYPPFLEVLAGFYILPGHYDPKKPIGSGPFKVQSFDGKTLTLEAVNNGTLCPTNIKNIQFITTQTNEFADALKNHTLDLTLQAPLSLAMDPPKGYSVFTSDYELVNVFTYYNLAKPYLKSKQNRLFLKKVLLETRDQKGFLSKFDKKLDHLMHPGILPADYYKPLEDLKDVKPDSHFPKKIKILSPNTFITADAVSIITSTFKKYGIEAEISLGKGRQLSDPASRGEFDLAVFPFEASQGDPDGFLFLFNPKSPLIEFFHLPTQGYMDEFEKIKFTLNKAERLKKYEDVFKRMESDEVIIPFFSQSMPFIYSDKVVPPKSHILRLINLRFFTQL